MAKTLLVVDDSTTMRKVFELTFAGEDISVVTHDGGDSLLARAREVKPAAAIVDVSLAGASGYDVCKALKADDSIPRFPILLLYSEQNPLDEARARDVGSDGSLVKPFDTQAAIDKVKAILGTGTTAAAAAPATAARPAAPAPGPSAAAPPGPARPAAPGPAAAPPGPPAAKPAMPAAAPPGMPPLSAAKPAPKPAPEPDVELEMDGEEVIMAPAPAAAPAPAPRAAAPAPAPAARPAAPAPAASAAPVSAAVSAEIQQRVQGMGLTPAQVDAVTALTREVVERVVWEVVPHLAETVIREEIRRLTAE